MKMKANTIIAALGALLFGVMTLSVRADYLYWMVDQSSVEKPIAFSVAKMVSQDGKTTYQTYDGSDGVLADSSGISTLEEAMNIGESSSYATKSFYIQLLTYNSTEDIFTILAKSEVFNFSALGSNISDSSITPANALVVSSFTVPEPTSALLMFFGLAGLALKRKTQFI